MRRRVLSVVIVLVGSFGVNWSVADEPPDRVPGAKRAIEPATPDLPAEIVAAMQGGRFAETIAALDRLDGDPKTTEDDRTYRALIRGIALRLSKKHDEARAALQKAIEAAPKGRWVAKLRSELAAVELAAGRFEKADELARAEAESLLADGRKDRLAEVYLAFARRLLEPDNPVAKPDPEAAYALLAQARTLARGADLRARLLLAMGKASQQVGNHARAIQDFQNYLNEYPKGADRPEVRLRLGQAQLAAGQGVAARLTWADLARDLEKADSKSAQQIRAEALDGIARTHGIPNPPDDLNLNLGVAALRRIVSDFPGTPLAVKAAYEIGASYLARGRSVEALEALSSFLKQSGDADVDDAQRDRAQLRMTAQFQTGQVLQGMEKFDEAIAAFQTYIDKYPNGPQSADAQRALLDTRLLIAQDHLRHEKYAEARDAWRTFNAQNPLDPRVPQVLFDIGQSFATQKKFDEAISSWETLIGKFPGTEPAGHAQFQVASTFETEKGDPAEAIERFRKIEVEPWKSQGAQRVAVMEAKQLVVVTPRTFRSGEIAILHISTRNLETLTFTAYRLDAEAYFRKKQELKGVEALDIGLVAPDAEWTAPVPKYGKYRPIIADYDLKKLELPGVYVVKVTDEKTLQAITLVIGSDLDAIVKASRDQVLVFAQDMKTGQGRAGVRVLIADDKGVILDAKTGKDGVLLQDWKEPRNPSAQLDYLVLDGDHAAGSGLGLPGSVAQGLAPRAYLYTDRPAYRPGQEVHLRGIVREVEAGHYANRPKADYRLEVIDSRGRPFVTKGVTLSNFGTFHDDLALDSSAPDGSYRVRLYRPGGSEFNGQFEVHAYQLQKVDLKFDLAKTVVFRGETIKGDLIARYQYGTPLANRPIEVQLPDGRVLRGRTDAQGKYHVEFPTEGFAEEQTLALTARLPEDNVAASTSVRLAVRAFEINLSTARDVYIDGESFPLTVTTTDPLGEPTGQSVKVSVLKRVEQAGRVTEREVSTHDLKTDPKTGKGVVELKVDDEKGGSYVVRAAATDRYKNPVVADHNLSISGRDDPTRLRLLADRLTFKVGETAQVTLHSRDDAGTALLTWEADRILSYKLIPIKKGDNEIEWEVEGAQFPNFTLAASRMAKSEFRDARLDLRAERDLRVTIRPTKETVGPGEEVEVELTTRDQRGRPVSAELSLALIDRALLRLYGDNLPVIGPFFYDQTRTGAFATIASNTFRYTPATTPVPEAVVEELERINAVNRDQLDMNAVRKEVKDLSTFNGAPARAGQAMMGGGMGGMGGGLGPEGGKLGAAGNGYYDMDSAARADVEKKARRRGGAMMGRMPANMPAGASAETPAESFFAKAEDAKAGNKFGLMLSDVSAGFAKSPSPTRTQFVETAYWNPKVVTGDDGKARVRFKAPLALSEYQFTARGVTGAETLVGQETADLAVRQDFFVDLKLPASLTEGDRPRFVARLHHRGIVGKAELRLRIYAGEREQVFPKTINLEGDGSDEINFEPFDVPDAENVRLTLNARAGDSADELTAEVPVRPWGVQAFASASGTASDDATVFVGLPEGRKYESPEMLIVISPSLRRMLVELALGRDAYPIRHADLARILPPIPDTTADRAGDLLANAATLSYLKVTKATNAPEAARLTDRIRSLVAELITLQNDDGGWPWVGGRGQKPSDRLTSARVVFALATAEGLGLLPDTKGADKAIAYLTQELAKVDGGDHEARAAIVHALSSRGKATFEQANALNRLRQNLSDAALAYLALTFANLDRKGLGIEVLGVLGPRSKTESAGPGNPERRYWEGKNQHPWHRSAAEATALAALAYARVNPEANELGGAVAWLLAHRAGNAWQPHKAKGPALAALALYYGKAQGAEDRYRLTIRVNDVEVDRLDVNGPIEGKAIRVPDRALKAGAKNRVRFDFEGRGQLGYAVTLTGFARDFKPDQDRAGRPFLLDRRVYLASEPELDGKTLPAGFGVAIDAQGFENPVTMVPLGGRARVAINAYRNDRPGMPAWERDFLILEEHLPAGTTLVEGSVNSQASRYELADGVLTFYFAPDQYPGNITYDVYGYLPGQYRALPPQLRSAYEPGRYHLGPAGSLQVLEPGAKSTDPYKSTPDELYARGKALFDADRFAEAAPALEALWDAYTLRADIAKEAARMLLAIHIKQYDPNKVVKYFEILREKSPELVIPFDDIRVVGRAYGDIGEHERAYLVWRATAEASYLDDARVGEALRQRGRPLEAVALLLDLWREYPDSAAIRDDLFGLSQVLANLATNAINDPNVRRALSEADATRSDLLLQSIRLIRTFLAQSPRDPLADEASLSLLGAFLELEDFEAVVKLAAQFEALYPKSSFFDSFQYSEALGRFHLGQYDKAIAVAEAIARATYKDENGVEQPSPNKWQALYILGQIFDARRKPSQAVAYYERVADRFTDAAEAVAALKRKGLKLPEVSVIKAPTVAQLGLRAVPVAGPSGEKSGKPTVVLDFRNLAEVDLKVYPVDLLRLYLSRRNLDQIANVDLAGIHPLLEKTVKLGDGDDFEDRTKELELPLEKEGAYLVMARGGNLYASGIVLVSPIELEVVEEGPSGRVRVRVRDAKSGDFVPGVQVRVIGTNNPTFFSGKTDLRGLYIAEGVVGQVTAVARQGSNRYAFYRGTTYVGQPPQPSAPPNPGQPQAQSPAGGKPGGGKPGADKPGAQTLDENLKNQFNSNQVRQLDRLQNRYLPAPSQGVQVDKANAPAAPPP